MLGFAQPWMLLGLIALPALWLLLRIVPPRPERVAFPPLRLLLGLGPTEETPARSPLWLTLLRLALAALVILGLAGPVWNPMPRQETSKGPLLLILDNGWPAAPLWEARMQAAADRLAAAQAQDRPLALLATAEAPQSLAPATPAAVRDRLQALVPRPWTPDRSVHADHVKAFLAQRPPPDVIWISDGLALQADEPFLKVLAPRADEGSVTIIEDAQSRRLALAGAKNEGDVLSVRVLTEQASFAAESPARGTVRAFDIKGRPIGAAAFAFEPGKQESSARFDLPVDLRNDIVRLEIAGEMSAGAVQLLDDRWHRRSVGLVSGQTRDMAQPLLSGAYYLARALEPYADVRAAPELSPAEAASRLVADKLPVIILADVGTLGDAQTRLEEWVEKGGVLVRFAGPRLARAGDALLPVTLRQGGRTLGSSLSWEQPQPLGSFAADGPFAGLAVPQDVSVQRQVLAEPDASLVGKTWASLADGTPLVTAAARGKGLVVLFHVTADTSWSNLPLSGLFVDMLRRVVALSNAAAPPAGTREALSKPGPDSKPVLLAATQTLDGWGRLTSPSPDAEPIDAKGPRLGTFKHPPGLYGPPDAFAAVNALDADAALARLDYAALGARVRPLQDTRPLDLTAWSFTLAILLLIADCLAVLGLSGGWRRLRQAAAPATALLVGLMLFPHDAHAQTPPPFAPALKTHMAYVVTGDPQTDEASLAGMRGLSAILKERTSLEPQEPIGLDLSKDELSFHALIYWPIVPGAAKPAPAVMAKIDAFMKSGGTILFDTRDALTAGISFSNSPAGKTLQQLLAGLDIPALEPVPRDHVLTKTFYLLERFPGRTEDGETWVEALPDAAEPDMDERPARDGDEVSSIIVTSNDLAAAWAVDAVGRPVFPLTPDSPRQRELAYRAGVNIVMYALTGNYKTDQVHMPALLERLGQ